VNNNSLCREQISLQSGFEGAHWRTVSDAGWKLVPLFGCGHCKRPFTEVGDVCWHHEIATGRRPSRSGDRSAQVNTVAGGPRPPSRKLWHITGSRPKRRYWLPEKTTKCYDKKPQRYAKDNRTAHLTARSDKSVAYVLTNNKRLDVLYCWS